jgi:hypothetical protein
MTTIDITLPTLHPGQEAAYLMPGRFKVIRCGRRWGKTAMAITIGADGAARGENIGYFAPDYKIQSEAFTELEEVLHPIKRSSSKVEGIIRTRSKGRIDFWTLENERAGRSRKYHKVIIDEAAFTKPNMMRVWETAIKPSLLDFQGECLVLSTPNGIDAENFFYRICTEPAYGFVEYHAPSHTNPYLPKEELAKLEKENHPLVYRQEYLAEFVDWSGVQFFSLDKMLVNMQPVPWPDRCDAVFAIIDTAIKTGKENDGTAVSYYAINKYVGHSLVALDWDIIQIEGSLLEEWLPSVYRRLEELSKLCGARMGSLGVFIEDKASGIVLIQQAQRRGWDAKAIDSKLTALGKDERAINVSGYVWQEKFKISEYAYNKTAIYKGITRNHYLTQVLGFRIGVENKDDDLTDTFTYALSIALGNYEGY